MPFQVWYLVVLYAYSIVPDTQSINIMDHLAQNGIEMGILQGYNRRVGGWERWVRVGM